MRDILNQLRPMTGSRAAAAVVAGLLLTAPDNRTDPAASCRTVDWAPSLAAALERAPAEGKPVLIAFSAHRQELEFDDEY